MKSINVSLKKMENVKEFVNIVSKYTYDVDLRSGRYVIDAKSIMGIFSLDLSKALVLEIHNDKCEDLIKDLKAFIA